MSAENTESCLQRDSAERKGVVTETAEGSPQGGNLSPLLANVYLNESDEEFSRRGVPCIRYADDIVLPAKSERASERLLETSTKYLEGTLKLKPPCTERYARWCERTAANHRLLLDFGTEP